MRFTLDIDYADQFDFELIGIRCAEKDFRLAWAINIAMNWTLVRTRDILLQTDGHTFLLSRYEYVHPSDKAIISLVQNRSEEGWLLPEWTQFDFLLKIESEQLKADDEVFRKLRQAKFIIAAFSLVTEKLKSKHHLIFWEYASTDQRRIEENKNRSHYRPGFGF